jgi:hypothetical protein
MPGPRLTNKVSFNGTPKATFRYLSADESVRWLYIVRFRSSPVPDRESLLRHRSNEIAPAHSPLWTLLLSCSGIGLETSLLFATEGSSLILADINLEAAERTATLIQNKFEGKIKAIAVRCDVSKEDQVEAIVKRAVDEFGRLDVMVSAWSRSRSRDLS